MHLFSSLTLISYLIYAASPLLAVPMTISSQAASPSQSLRTRQHEHRPRVFSLPDSATFIADSLTHRTTFTQLMSFYPISSAVIRHLHNIYFEIYFNLSPHGQWYNIPAMSSILLQEAGIYLLFYSTNPKVPVPWSLVKEWAEAMELALDRGGFCGTYVASIGRLTANGLVDFWIHMGTGSPPALAATAARKRLKGK